MRTHFIALALLFVAPALLVSVANAQRNEEDSFFDGLRNLRAAFTPVGEGDLLASLSGRKAPEAQRSSSGTRSSSATGPPVGECGKIMNKAFAQLQAALQAASSLRAQTGEVDFGFFGDANDTANCGQNCAYTNPTSPYGLTVLPLSTNETLSKKLSSKNLPDYARKDLQQRRETPSPPSGSPSMGARRASSSGAKKDVDLGMAAIWQLAPDEVVLVAGCLPPANASRYFAWTPYLHSLYNDRADNWVSVFASLGDSIGVYVQQQPDNLQQHGVRNRLNTSLPRTLAQQLLQQSTSNMMGGRQASRRVGDRLGALWSGALEQVLASAPSSGVPSKLELLGPGAKSGNKTSSPFLWEGLKEQTMVKDVADMQRAQAQAYYAGSEEPYDRFSIVIMSASKKQSQKVQDTLRSALDRLGLLGSINVLAIPPPFASEAGLQTKSAYFMLLARNILGMGQLPAFRNYLRGDPWRVWRITPRTPQPSGLGILTTPAPGPRVFDPSTEGFPPAKVVPRSSPSLNQSEEWLRPAMNWLLKKVDRTLVSQGQRTSWSLTSASALQSAGIDWGIDCFRRRIDFCNGDNRDAQYIISFPLVSLGASRVLYLVGVNHVMTGMASYVNVAPSDPIQRLGLASWDDQEMLGSADALMADGPYAGVSSMFYVAAYSRNCTGLPYCKEIPLTGARSLPLTRSMIVLLRAYVNPITGVGPNASAMVNFRTVVATPAGRGWLRDSNSDKLELDSEVMDVSQCTTALTSLAVTCPQVLRPASQPQSAALAIGNASLHRVPVGAALWAGVTAVVPSIDGMEESDCCMSVGNWTENKCFCSQAGAAVLNALLPLPARALIAGVGRACGQPVLTSLSSGCV